MLAHVGRPWKHLRPHKAFKVDPPARFVRKEALGGTVPSRSRQHAPPNCMLTATPLRLNHPSFKKTSGTITKIAQSHGDIAVASATSGGVPDTRTNQDDPQPEVDAYNRDGNLLVWTGQEFFKLKAHERNWIVSSHVGRELISHEQTKVYTVNDIAFDPIRPRRLVSSGNDCAVRIWDLQNHVDESFDVRPQNRLDYTHAPHDISFKPNSSVFAVSCFDGNIHVHPRNDEHFELGVCDPSASKPGTFLWGGTAANTGLHNLLFASSESNDDENSCSHVAFDVELQRQIYEFKIYDSGDSMALDPNGETLALITSTSDSHTLSLFDVGRADGRRAFAELALPPQVHVPNLHAAQQDKLEVSFAAFSPDSVLLALARTDDVTLVYDARFLGNGRPGGARPWACLRHPPSAAGYGTTGLHWVDGFARGSLGLVTAASDGCVRLWDVMRAPASEEESLVLAKLDNDIACFSVGDQYKNERRLVVGDCSGEVYIFD
ncbi:WD40-repeat-containing domain protein [Phellopilus nigrolimitatus]|nr:WD40-repeat-containing domain protein [Phellopilus nigrolimitatus]